MNTISILLRDYHAKDWPSIEVNNFSKSDISFFLVLYISSLVYSFYTFTHDPRAEDFLLPLIIPVILLLIKNRLFFFSTLIVLQNAIAFLAIGNPQDVATYTTVLVISIFAISRYERGYQIAIVSMFTFFLPSVYGYYLIHLVLLALLIGLAVKRDFIINTAAERKDKINSLMFVFFIYINASVLWGPNILSSSIEYVNTLSIFLVYWLTLLLIHNKDSLKKALITWAIAGAVYAAIRVFVPPSTNSDIIDIPTTKNTVSSLINFSIFAAFPVITLRYLKLPRIVLVVTVLMMIVVNFFINSKGGFGSMIIGAGLYFLMMDKYRTKAKAAMIKLSINLMIVFTVSQVLLVPLLYYNLKIVDIPYAIESDNDLGTLMFRIEQWDIAKTMIQDEGNYFTGLGFNGYASYYSTYAQTEGFRYEWMAHPHSLYVHVYTNYGLIGMLLFTAIIVAFFRRMKFFLLSSQNMPFRIIALAIVTCIFAFLIHGLVDWSLIDLRFWFIIGTGISLTLIDKKLGNPIVPLNIRQNDV